jgi:hypothetical protein
MQRVGLLIMALIISTPIHADENPVKVPFLFTEDQNAPQVDLNKNITRSDALRNHLYLTGPITRLDYMLIQMERRLNREFILSSIKTMLKKNFERVKKSYGSMDVEGFARYSDDLGKVIVGYVVQEVGRARKPMRKTCEALLLEMEWTVPQENRGFSFQRVLGVLEHTNNYATYMPMFNLLAENIVYKASITSWTSKSDAKGKIIHTFQCQREKLGGKIVYSKMSFSVGGKRRK